MKVPDVPILPRSSYARSSTPLSVIRSTSLLEYVHSLWCNRLRGWTFRNWWRIWFSDESGAAYIRVYRRRNERFSSSCVQEVDSFSGGSVMMWAAISNDHRTDLQPLNLLHQRPLSRLCNGVNTVPKYGLLGLMSCCRNRLRTACELIFRNQGIPAVVVDAATVRYY
jgi:hypothetical protein